MFTVHNPDVSAIFAVDENEKLVAKSRQSDAQHFNI